MRLQRPGIISSVLNAYEMSSKEESSPLGWNTTMKNIKDAGDRDFNKHAFKFYRKQDDSWFAGLAGLADGVSFSLSTPLAVVGLVVLFFWMQKKS